VRPAFQGVTLQIDPSQKEYTGSVTIELDVLQRTPEVFLHAEDMTVKSVALRRQDGTVKTTFVQESPFLTVRAAAPLDAGKYTLDVTFDSPFNTQAVGLYRMEQDGVGYAFTQFEAADARKAFPCFDEPGFKFPWHLTVSVPEGQIAVSNTPIESETVRNGWHQVSFMTTKPLPSYLIALGAGPLVATPIPGLSVPGAIYTVQGQEHLTGLAAEMAPPILAELEKYFKMPYPYRKLDLIAIPEYWPGAMEHPGAVTFSASLLCIDPAVASMSQRRTLARVEAHEFAHMWFGDLVTMTWWEDLWLNESFADWMGDKIAQRVYPEYNLEVAELQSSMDVMVGDARPSSVAIRQPVKSTDRLMENVGVQYNKGKAVLAMIEQWMGEDTFQEGVLSYLERHKWGSAQAEDFWDALRRVSMPEITEALASFIEQPGLPMVRIEPQQGNRVRISQERFANHGVSQPQELTWAVPIVLKYSDGERIHTKTVFLDSASQEVTLDSRGQPAWILPNADQRGYYRWVVPPQMLAQLARNATNDLTERERVGFISNLSALLDAGVIHGDDYLFALGEFADDPKPMVVTALMNGMEKVETAFVPADLEDAFAGYVRRTLSPALERFGATARAGEPEEVALFRPRLLAWLADSGKDAATLAYATEQADRFLQDPTSIDASVAGTVLRLSALKGDQARYDDYKSRFENAQVPVDRGRYLSAMGSFRDPQIRAQALAYVFEGPLRPNELFRIPGAMMGSAEGRDVVFAWMQEHYDDFKAKLPPMFMGFMPFVAGGCSAERLEAARVFFADPEHQAPGTETQLAKVTDSVNDCVGLREREGDAVAAWLNDQAASR